MTAERRTAAQERSVAVLVVLVRIVLVAAAVVTVVVARTVVGWGSVALMLAALGLLIAVLASYNRRFR
ncbi:DUF6903 family protein [Microbacterium sp. M1A1_1b]